MSHESLDSKEISVEVRNGNDDSIRGMVLFTEDRELADCRLVLGNDSSLREKERRPVWKTI